MVKHCRVEHCGPLESFEGLGLLDDASQRFAEVVDGTLEWVRSRRICISLQADPWDAALSHSPCQ